MAEDHRKNTFDKTTEYDRCFASVFPRIPSYKAVSSLAHKKANGVLDLDTMKSMTVFDMGLIRWLSGCGYGSLNPSYDKSGPITGGLYFEEEDSNFKSSSTPPPSQGYPETISIIFVRHYSKYTHDYVLTVPPDGQKAVGKYSNQCLSGFVSYYGLIYWVNFFPQEKTVTWRLAHGDDIKTYNTSASEFAKDSPFSIETFRKWLYLSRESVHESTTVAPGEIQSDFVFRVLSNILRTGYHSERPEIKTFIDLYCPWTDMMRFSSMVLPTLTKANQFQLHFFVSAIAILDNDVSWETITKRKENDIKRVTSCTVSIKGANKCEGHLDNTYEFKIRYTYGAFKVNDSEYNCWASGLLRQLLKIRESEEEEKEEEEEVEEEKEDENRG
jgi:hypothetical protein